MEDELMKMMMHGIPVERKGRPYQELLKGGRESLLQSAFQSDCLEDSQHTGQLISAVQ